MSIDEIFARLQLKSPRARIQALRRHAALHKKAAELDDWLADLGGKAGAVLLNAIQDAEYKALAIDTAPAVAEKKRRLDASPASVSDDQIIQALRNYPTQQDAADYLGITAKRIRDRIPQHVRQTIKAEKRKS